MEILLKQDILKMGFHLFYKYNISNGISKFVSTSINIFIIFDNTNSNRYSKGFL